MLRTPVCFRILYRRLSPQFQFSLSAVTLGIYLGGLGGNDGSLGTHKGQALCTQDLKSPTFHQLQSHPCGSNHFQPNRMDEI
jgi:hypothetical protein